MLREADQALIALRKAGLPVNSVKFAAELSRVPHTVSVASTEFSDPEMAICSVEKDEGSKSIRFVSTSPHHGDLLYWR